MPIPYSDSDRRRADAVSKSADRLGVLHDRIVAGDLSAVDVLYNALSVSITARLRREFFRVEPNNLQEAFDDAFLDYLREPGRVRSSSVWGFVHGAAWRNLADAAKGERRRKRREWEYATMTGGDHNTGASSNWLWNGEIDALLATLVLTTAERLAVAAWFRHARDTDAIASALGVAHLPQSERRREVKRFKDRLVKRIERLTNRRDGTTSR